jgi:hypothetical protein
LGEDERGDLWVLRAGRWRPFNRRNPLTWLQVWWSLVRRRYVMLESGDADV